MQQIESDFLGGIKSGVTAKPKFSINNQKYDDARDYDSLNTVNSGYYAFNKVISGCI